MGRSRRRILNHVFKKWLSDNDIIMYSTFNEGKSVVAERFIRTLKINCINDDYNDYI